MFRLIPGMVLSVFLASCTAGNVTIQSEPARNDARFSWFEYAGDDEVFRQGPTEDEYQNPVLAGYYPDPSIVRVGDDFYLVNSTFGFFPGIPVFHSRDLVDWIQLGNAVERPEQISFDGVPLGNGGVYAPSINYRDGIFYVINTCIGCGGNFVVKASDPAGPWSDPIWMPHLDGIDPSIFFDEDGGTYVVHQRTPARKRFDAHSSVWVMKVDPETFAPLSEDVMLVDGGEEAPWNTDYLEGPHIYKVDGRYYLSAAGGGTGYYHQQLVYRSGHVFGPYTADPNNPVLTQFGLPDDRPHPVTATGHADMFQDTNGDWWAVFLGTRVFDLATPPQDPGNFLTGRETFMLPVKWHDGWPVILEKGRAVPYHVKRPALPAAGPARRAMTGNYEVREEFTEASLGPEWLFVRTPHSKWWKTGGGALVLEPRAERIGDGKQPAFVGRRLAHMRASFGAEMEFFPVNRNDEAGLLAVQNDDYFYAFGLGRDAAGQTVLRVRKKAGQNDPVRGNVIAETAIDIAHGEPLYLRMHIDKSRLDFSYSLDGESYSMLLGDADSGPLTTAMAGGFTGAVVGMYAEGGDQ